ncbi:MlaD family protein [Lamprobacter modestohalophilus]|uniref:MlaD family protein n=1 Tax=Lamprobacter modestohalophilus TaxID=1064514 RepID=UPI002ADEBCA7|nr:MlaD family protein [Lamprobacter modestohalophilus]MEA1050834.1 MlaD family protein [Lamprobacter modestohalophilus]
MSREANPTIIGGFVLGAVALVVIGILVFSSGAWLRERIYLVTYFPGSVQGLNVGAQVQFQGVPIGQVVEIGLDYIADRDSFRIPVRYEVWPKTIHVLGNLEGTEPSELLQRLVDERGLRAQLESVSFVTGQYLVTLSLNPDLPKRDYPPSPDETIRVPAIAATRDRVQEMLENLHLDELVDTATQALEAINTLLGADQTNSALSHLDQALAGIASFIDKIDREIAPLSERANATLTEYQKLAETLRTDAAPLLRELSQATQTVTAVASRVEAKVDPLANSAQTALDEAAAAMNSISQLTGESSSTRYELDQLLATATRAANSIRALADYLERHPESLLQGKR